MWKSIGRNKLRAVTALAVSILGYVTGLFAWSSSELNKLDRKKMFLLDMVYSTHKVTEPHSVYQEKRVEEDISDAYTALEQKIDHV